MIGGGFWIRFSGVGFYAGYTVPITGYWLFYSDITRWNIKLEGKNCVIHGGPTSRWLYGGPWITARAAECRELYIALRKTENGDPRAACIDDNTLRAPCLKQRSDRLQTRPAYTVPYNHASTWYESFCSTRSSPPSPAFFLLLVHSVPPRFSFYPMVQVRSFIRRWL